MKTSKDESLGVNSFKRAFLAPFSHRMAAYAPASGLTPNMSPSSVGGVNPRVLRKKISRAFALHEDARSKALCRLVPNELGLNPQGCELLQGPWGL